MKLNHLLKQSSAVVAQERPADSNGREYASKPAVEGREGQAQIIEKYGNRAIASYRNAGVAPLEFFEAMSMGASLLNDPVGEDPTATQKQFAIDAGIRRTRVARVYSEMKEGSQITPMASVDLERTGGAFGPRSPADHKIDCLKLIVAWERFMPAQVKAAMEAAFLHGRFIFDVPSKRARELVMENIRCGLDIVAVERAEMRLDEFRQRWKGVPISTPEKLASLTRAAKRTATGSDSTSSP
jgi:hypothetical protein